MGKKKTNPKISFQPQEKIKTTDITTANKKIAFSYEYIDLNNSKYSFEGMDNKQIIRFHNDFHKKVCEYCQKKDFKKSLSEKLWKSHNHIHPIDWSDKQIREAKFTSLDSKLMEQVKDECWQLGINNNGFRIHGFFIENIFYIVWLDPLHNLYHTK